MLQQLRHGTSPSPQYIPSPIPTLGNHQSIFSLYSFIFSRMSYNSVQFSHSVVSDSLQPHGLQHTYLFITNSQSLHKLMSIELVMPTNHLILCRPLLLPPSIFPSIRAFSNESILCIRCPKYWSFSFSLSPSNEYSGLISFRLDWLYLPCSPRDSQEISQTSQFKSINSSVLSFLYSSTLTSIHDANAKAPII